MPTSKHRRKHHTKAVRHPGRLTALARATRDEGHRTWETTTQNDICDIYEELAPTKLPPAIINEAKSLWNEGDRLAQLGQDLTDEQEQRAIQLDAMIEKAIPETEIAEQLCTRGYGTPKKPLPAELGWSVHYRPWTHD